MVNLILLEYGDLKRYFLLKPKEHGILVLPDKVGINEEFIIDEKGNDIKYYNSSYYKEFRYYNYSLVSPILERNNDEDKMLYFECI